MNTSTANSSAAGAPNAAASTNSSTGNEGTNNANNTNNTNTNTNANSANNSANNGFSLTAEDTSYMSSLVQNKGFDKSYLDNLVKDPHGYKMFTSYRAQEKLIGEFQGGDKIMLPKDPGDKAAMDTIYDKLGRPKAPTDYKIEVPQGGDSGFALEASKWFHGAGLNQQQVTALTSQWEAYAKNVTTQSEANDKAKAAEEIDATVKGWGADSKINGEIATRGLTLTAKELGWDAGKVEAIREGHNVALSASEALKLWKLMGDLGKTTGDSFVGDKPGERQSNAGMTPQQAKDRINTLINDREFHKRRTKGDANAVKEWDDLHKVAATS